MHQAVGQLRGEQGHIATLQQDHELVAAKPRQDGVIAAQCRHRTADAAGELQQRLVAGLVAQGVVDPFEVVDVGEQQRQLAVGTACGVQQMVQAFAEAQAVGQPGQRVGVGHVAHLAIVPGNAFTHAPERGNQLADFVVARMRRQLHQIVAAFDLPRRRGQQAHRRHQRALHIDGQQNA